MKNIMYVMLIMVLVIGGLFAQGKKGSEGKVFMPMMKTDSVELKITRASNGLAAYNSLVSKI